MSIDDTNPEPRHRGRRVQMAGLEEPKPFRAKGGVREQIRAKFKRFAERHGLDPRENSFKRAQRTFQHEESLSSAGGTI